MTYNWDLTLRRFKITALSATISTYVLIFVGGLVRVSGAGLGCPDWPKCFGRWIPPTDVSDLPAHIDPNLFNFTLAWIEYINRLIGLFVGLLILGTAVFAILRFRKYPKILYSSVAAAVLVAFQGWQGSQVVASALEPLAITLHMALAFIIVSLLLYTTFQAYVVDNPALIAIGAVKIKPYVMSLYALTIVQVIMGTQLRSAVQIFEENIPVMEKGNITAHLGSMGDVHLVLGILIALLATLTTYKVFRLNLARFLLLKNSIILMNALVVGQIFVGFLLYYAGMPAVMQVVHLWLSSFMVGNLLLMYATAK